jgi:hypothetical protein
VITTNNQLYSIDNTFFSARRPHGDNMVLSAEDKNAGEDKAQLELKSVDYPAYDAVIPYISTKYLSYDLHLVDQKDIKAFPTRLESTTQIISYGFDLFCIRVSPENNFDLLQENFNYSLLFLIIGGLAVVLYVVKEYVRGSTNKSNFLLL